jgi:hypothetical protein
MVSITDFFNQRIFGRQFQDLFEQMAKTITREYIQEIYDHIEANGTAPSFEYIMGKVKALTTELTMRAEWIREDYREGRGHKSIKLTTGCKRIIKTSVDEYLRQSKTVMSIRPQQASYAY